MINLFHRKKPHKLRVLYSCNRHNYNLLSKFEYTISSYYIHQMCQRKIVQNIFKYGYNLLGIILFYKYINIIKFHCLPLVVYLINKSIVLRCTSRLENIDIACKAITVNKLLLQDIILEAINKLLSDKTRYLGVLQVNIATVAKASIAVSESNIDVKLLALQKELIKRANNKDKYDAFAEDIFELRELKHKSELKGVTIDDNIKPIAKLQDFIKAVPTTLTEYDENLVNRLL